MQITQSIVQDSREQTMTATHPSGHHVVLLATGGTISSRDRGDAGALASDTGAEVLSGAGGTFPYPVRVVDVFRQGSYLLTVDSMLAICESIHAALTDPQVLGVVVTHGTDTLEETAYLSDLTHDDPRPVVFTGAQNAADSEHPDGPDNLRQAIAVAGSPAARNWGVLVAFAGDVYPAQGIRKTHTSRLAAFENPDFGSAGNVGPDGVVRMQQAPGRAPALQLPVAGQAPGPRVDLVCAYPGADATLLRAALAAGAEGIVLQATGNGNANMALCAEIARAVAAGVVVVTSTRVQAGPVMPFYGSGGGKDLLAAGAVPSGLLRPSQSLVLLSLLLRLGTGRQGVKDAIAARSGPPALISANSQTTH